MFTVKKGNLFENVERGFIMHGCNAQGVMGSGVAKIIRDKYPIAYEKYAEQAPHYILGEVIPVIVEPNLVIVNAITQEFYGTDRVQVDYDAVEQACRAVKHLANSGIIESNDIYFPFIGAGLAGGDKEILLNIFKRQFGVHGSDEISAARPPAKVENPENNDATMWVL